MPATKKATAQTTVFDSFASFQPETFKDSFEKLTENVSEATAFAKSYYDAYVEAGTAVTKGFEAIATEQAEFAKSLYENRVSSAKSAFGAKSVQEAIEIQTEFVRETLDKNLSHTHKVGDLAIDTSKKSMAPLATKYTELVEKIQAFRG